MHDLWNMMPDGWSITPTCEGWTIRDDDDDVVATGPDMAEVKRILTIEFALQQAFAAIQLAQAMPVTPEA